MKVGFFHDVKIIENNDGNKYSVDFGYEVCERYLRVFDKIVICTRIDEKNNVDISKYKVSSGNNVEFKLNRDYKSPIQFFTQRRKINNSIKNVVKDVDACIVRMPSVIGILAIKECIKQKKPWVVEVVGCCWDSLWHYGSIKGKLLAPIMYLYTRYYINKSNYAMYVSNSFLQKRYPCSGMTVSVSDVNIGSLDKAVLLNRLEKIKSRDPKKKIVLGLIGSLDVEYKGHKTAMKAIKELQKRGYDIELKCLGSGNKERWFRLAEQLSISKNVDFCGTLPSGEPVFEWMDNIDILVMPSLTEGLPRAMVESMSRGCNVIGADVGGIPELIQKEFIFPKKNYKKFADLICKIIDEKDIAIYQSKFNFERSKEFSPDRLDKKRNDFLVQFRQACYCK